MNTLEIGTHTIRPGDYTLLNQFVGEPVTPQYIQNFCKEVSFSDMFVSLVKDCPAEDVLRQSILLSIAAIKSDDFFNEIMYGFNITIRSSGELRTNCYVDIDGYTVIHLIEDWYGDSKWKIQFLHPILFTDDYLYATEAVMKLCR